MDLLVRVAKTWRNSIRWYMPFCPDKKKIPDNFFCPLCQCPWFFCLYFFLSLRPLNCCPCNLCPYFCLTVQQGHCTYFRNILQLLRNTRALIITTCLIKLWSKLPNIPLKISSLTVWERLCFESNSTEFHVMMLKHTFALCRKITIIKFKCFLNAYMLSVDVIL